MGRPKKPDHLKMTTDLRIPMTPEQKSIVDAVTCSEPMGMASWVRTVILEAAQTELQKRDAEKKKAKGK